jgi:dihydrofolate synthase/folylpolyglutamate synthase
MTYQETLAYLSSLDKMGIRLGLDPVRRLLERLGNPQEGYPTVLVAGTNGKGSVAAMIASILTTGGYRTGLYTSPDLIDLRERIRIDGVMIGQDEIMSGTEQVKRQIAEPVSYFEFLTALALLHFHRRKVDVAVLEIGLGGRLDATNVVVPLVSVITNIALEHREYLGGTLAEIAREKGGIIKPGGRCLTGAVQPQAIAALEAICRERGATLRRLGREIRCRIHPDGSFSYRGIGRRHDRLVCPLAGRHQITNASLAIGAVEWIAESGLLVAPAAVAKGLAMTRWEGRLEVLQRDPLLLVDGAHNPAGVAALCRALKRDFTYRRLWLIFGVLGDKDYRRMARRLFPLAHAVILTRPLSGRSLPPDALKAAAVGILPNVEVREDPGDALGVALSRAAAADLVCVAGSLYLVGEIKRIHRGRSVSATQTREGDGSC